MECVKLDDDLVNKDPRIWPLLDKFVRVRLVSTNGLDLSLFQYDFDQSFAVFFLNADRTIYGRFGTRSHRTSWVGDVSIDGLAKAAQGAFDLHAQYPKNKAALAGKKGTALEVSSPEKYPTLKDKYGPTLNYKGNVVQSCIHCHQIAEARKVFYRKQNQPIPESILFPYPHPKMLGLILDPKEKATVLRVEKDSPAEKAGFRKGDMLLTLAGQPLLSIADVQWVLDQAPADGASLTAEVRRRREKGVRSDADPGEGLATARESVLARLDLGPETHDRRHAAGRACARIAPRPAYRKRAWPPRSTSPRSRPRKAGFLQGDIILSFDGNTTFQREPDLLAYAVTQRKPGEKVAVTVLRSGKKRNLTLPMQD